MNVVSNPKYEIANQYAVESLDEILEFEGELVSTCTCNGSDKC